MEADYLLLADRAEAVNGKLYLVGGGWDRLTLATLPGPADFDVVAGVLVGYNETNTPHQVELLLEDEDNRPVLGPIAARFELGRPPGIKQGQSQRFQVVIRGPFPLPGPGAYHWVLALDGVRTRMTGFWVDRAASAATTPPASAPDR